MALILNKGQSVSRAKLVQYADFNIHDKQAAHLVANGVYAKDNFLIQGSSQDQIEDRFRQMFLKRMTLNNDLRIQFDSQK